MKPLWLQKVKDENKNVEQRARSNHEKRANAKLAHALSKEYDFDRALKAPNLWKSGLKDLQNEQNESSRHEGQEEGEGNDPGMRLERERRTTKSLTAELQLLRVPVTSWPGRKVKSFHDWIAEISTLPLPILPISHTYTHSMPVTRKYRGVVHVACGLIPDASRYMFVACVCVLSRSVQGRRSQGADDKAHARDRV